MKPSKLKTEKLDYAERWLRLMLEINNPPTTFSQIFDVDMSRCKELINYLKTSGTQITYTHILVHAVAISLQALPELHQIIIGNSRYFLPHVNVGLMVAGTERHFSAPMMIIAKAEQMNLLETAKEIVETVPKTREWGTRQLEFLRRWGWIIPFDFLRRPLLFWLQRICQQLNPKDQICFIISTSPGVIQCAGTVFSTTGEILAGAISDKVVAVDGQPVVRPMWTITCTVDHRVWNGQMGEKFILQLKSVLEDAAFALPEKLQESN